MLLLVSGLVLFFVPHFISIVNEPWRDAMLDRIGDLPWKILYSAVSMAGLVLMIWGYGCARMESAVLYTPPVMMQYVSGLLLLAVFPLFAASFLPGRIKNAVKHPQLAGIKIWAFSHLLVNGTLADMLLFGSFLVWAVIGLISMKHRKQRPAPGLPPSGKNDIIAVVSGLTVYLLFVFFLHGWLIGVPAFAH